MIKENCPKSMMPGTRCLFETIKSFVKATQIIRISRILKTWRLAHEHLFFKHTMKKGTIIGCIHARCGSLDGI
jgi:hypothetical protein